MTITDIITELLRSTAWRMEPPEIGGAFHITSVLVICACAVAAAVSVSRIGGTADSRGVGSHSEMSRSDADSFRIRVLFALGCVMLASEVYKQLFYYYIVNGRTYDWWFFPFQLCSVPMYMCLLLPLLRRSGSSKPICQAMLTFMCTFTFVSAAAALIWPEDMLRPYVTLTWHGLIWHGILLFISVMIGLSGMADLTRKGFLRSAGLFLVLCLIAILINVMAEPVARSHPVNGPISYPNMFYLSPYHASTQPVVRMIDASFGRAPAMAVYILAVIALAWISCRLFRAVSLSGRASAPEQDH